MSTSDKQLPTATYGWQDAMPELRDDVGTLMAKYKLLKFIHQVQKERLQKCDHICGQQGAQAAHHQPPATAPGPVPTSSRGPPASHEGHQLMSPVQFAYAIGPAQETYAGRGTPHDCKTPHHTMLPAPGANMLPEAGHPFITSTLNTAGPGSGQEDPIVVTAKQSKQQGNSSMPAKRKPGSKTWNTLNFLQASHAAQSPQLSHATHPTHASSPSPAPFNASQQHPFPLAEESNAAPTSPQDVTGSPDIMHPQHDKYQHSAQAQPSHGDLPSAALPSSPPCMSAACANTAHFLAQADHAHQPAQAASRNTQPCEAAAAVAQACTALQCSETQPDPHFAQAANQAVWFDTPHASVLRPSGSLAKLEPDHLASQAGTLNAEGASPAFENVPDSSGNTFAPSEAHLQHCSQPCRAAPEGEEARSTAGCSSQDAQGWHLQLDGAVIAVVAHGRYVAAVTGSVETMYCMTVMRCTLSQAQTICQTRLHAGELPCEPWQLANCIQLEYFRDEPLVFMSSLIQPGGIEQHLQPGVSVWTFQEQQPELRCHMETVAAPYCVVFASGAIAAAGDGAFLKLWKLDDQLVCQGQVQMAPAKYQSLAFPDIVQLAYVGAQAQFIAGCSSTGLLAIWSISGALLMAHCHPLMMVHSIHQAPFLHLAQQAHEPDAFVLLAFTQQHPNSQHLVKMPGQFPAALVLTKDHMFVGASMCPATQEPVGAVLVAGDMAIAVDVQGESIVWDLLKGEILQNHILHTGVQAAACTRVQSGMHPDMVFVGTCTGKLHMFKTPACC